MQSKSTRGVQQHEVDAAADSLVGERKRPTIERVRQKLGRGSPNTIAPMLEAWFETLAPRLGVTHEDDGEGAMPPEVRGATEALWRSALLLAQSQAAQSIQSERAAMAEEKRLLTDAQASLEIARAQLISQEKVLRDSLTSAQGQVEYGKNRILTLEKELARSGSEITQVRESLGKSVLERDADRRRFENQIQTNALEREKQLERAAANERRLLEEVDRARQETKLARSEIATTGKKHELVVGELVRAKQQLNQEMGDHKVVVAALTEKLTATEQRVRDFQELLRTKSTVSRKARSTLSAGRLR